MGDVDLPQWLKALPQAPEFHPTDAEFADPVAYILKIEHEAREYGICKIIPPFSKASRKVVINNLNRSLSLSCEPLSNNRHGSIDGLTRSMSGPQLAKPKGPALNSSCTDSGGKAKFATRRQQLGWNPKRARGVAHSQNHKLVWQSGESYTLEQFEAKAKMFARSRLGTCKDVSPLSVESLFWRAAADKPISVEYANDIPGSAFSEPSEVLSLKLKKRKRGLEEVEHGYVSAMNCGSDDHLQEVEDPSASEELESWDAMKAKTVGSEMGGDNAGVSGLKLASSAWNMRNVARSRGSLLRFMPDEVPGVTSPMVYIGMLFSWFAWHVEDHELHSLNYLHLGACKTWYAVPGDAAPALEEAIRVHGYGGHLNSRAAFSLLGEKTTVMSPEVLVAAGVPCCRLVQNAGEYVVTFPRAYHLGFSHGFNCGEAANFATPGWLEVAKEAAARRAAMNYLPMLSHQQLLYLLTMSLPLRITTSSPSEPRSSRLKVRKRSLGDEMVKRMFVHDVVHNNQFLRILLDMGVSRCLLAKDSVKSVSPNLDFSEDLENGNPASCPLKSIGQAIVPHLLESCDPSGQHVDDADKNYVESQPPSPAVPSALANVETWQEPGASHFIRNLSARSEAPVIEQGHDFVEVNPAPVTKHKISGSLAVDWGTLPCAACGILCYATMAVVEPSSIAAMTFKPIYAAAGLGHCAIESDDLVRIPAHALSCSQQNLAVDSTQERLVCPLKPADTDGGPHAGEQDLSLQAFVGSAVCIDKAGATSAQICSSQQISTRAHGCVYSQTNERLPEVVLGHLSILPPLEFEGKEEGEHVLSNSPHIDSSLESQKQLPLDPGHIVSAQLRLLGDEHDMQNVCGRLDGVIQDKSKGDTGLGIKGACILAPTVLGVNLFSREKCDDAVERRNLKEDSVPGSAFTTSFVAPNDLSICHASDAKTVGCNDASLIAAGQLLPPPSEASCPHFRIDAQPVCGKENELTTSISNYTVAESHEGGLKPGDVLSSLQLLASIYEENSDVEIENVDQSAEKCDSLLEDEIINYHDLELNVVLGKPHNGVGDLLTDEVGLSADVPWLSLAPLFELTELPVVLVGPPMFTLSSLLEGPKSLGKVFVSSGFCFVKDDLDDPIDLGSFHSDKKVEKIDEHTHQDGDFESSIMFMDGEESGKDEIQELYHRINSEALTIDTEGEEQLLLPFGGRPRIFSLSHNAINRECNCNCREEVASLPRFGCLAMDPDTVCSAENISPTKSSGPSNKDIVFDSPIKNRDMPCTTEGNRLYGGVSMTQEQICLSGSSLISNQDGEVCLHVKDGTKETSTCQVSLQKPRRHGVCSGVARPRVLCLEHAVEAQKRLQPLGGARVIIVCHSDFDKYELRGKSFAEEFGIKHPWMPIPFAEGADDEVTAISSAVGVDDEDGSRVSDWVRQMGLFTHHRFQEKGSEMSDDSQNATEDFREGPFKRVKSAKLGRSRLTASRLGLLRPLDVHPKSYSGSSSQIAVLESSTQPKTSKKKKCTVAGRWCGKVWRINQVHAFLGGSRKVDPSLQLGMSSTSLYALSVVSECNGNKFHKVVLPTRPDGSSSGYIFPVKNAEDQQGAALRKRGRKRKDHQQSLNLQTDSQNVGRQKVDTSVATYLQKSDAMDTAQIESAEYPVGPVYRTLTNGIVGPEQVHNFGNTEEMITAEDGLLSENYVRHFDQDHGADHAGTSEVDLHTHQMLAPIPLAFRDPSAVETNNCVAFRCETPENEIRGKLLSTLEPIIGNKSFVATEIMGSSEAMLSERPEIENVKTCGFRPSPCNISGNDLESPQLSTIQDMGGDPQASSLLNVLSTLPSCGRVDISGSSSSLVTRTTSVEKCGSTITGQKAHYFWRDVPVNCAPSFNSSLSHFARQTSNALPNLNQNQVYIPYVKTSSGESVPDQNFAGHTSEDEILFSVVSKTFRSVEQGGTKLNGGLLMNGLMSDSGSGEENLEKASPSAKGCVLPSNELENTVKSLPASNLNGVKRKRDRKISWLTGKKRKSAFVVDKVLNVESVAPLFLDRPICSDVVVSDLNCCDGPSHCSDSLESFSEPVLCEVDVSQGGPLDIKNIVKLQDGSGQTPEDGAMGLVSTLHSNEHSKEEVQSASSSDPLNIVEEKRMDCLVYHRKQAIGLNPILSLSPTLIKSCHPRSVELGFADRTGQGGALEHPLGNLLPLPTSSRRRSTVKVTGKCAKHVGWTSYKHIEPKVPMETLVKSWAPNHLSQSSTPTLFSLQSEECVEARYEVEECERGLEIPNQSTGPISSMTSLRLRGLPAEEVTTEEIKDMSDIAPAKPKKGRPKKKKVSSRKAAAEENGEFQCDLDGCRMSFATDAELQIHKRNRCTFKGCGKRFFMHKYLLQHRRVHLDDRPLKCPWKGCKQAFKWAWARTEHIRVHTGERPYACPECEQTFRFVSDFSRHKRNTGHTKS